jgi:hypothetical protein
MTEEKKISLGTLTCPHCRKSIILTKIVTIIEPGTKTVKEEKIVGEKNPQSTLLKKEAEA